MSRERTGLDAVARVRKVREQDSRVGLQQALTEARASREQLEALRSELDDVPPTTAAATAAFVALRTSLLALGEAITEARTRTEGADSIADAARERWQSDRTRLEAVEQLLQARADEARAEADRAEARDLDELATQGFVRRTAEAAAAAVADDRGEDAP